MAESNFNFFDDILKDGEKETLPSIPPAEVEKLKVEIAEETLKAGLSPEEKEEFATAEKSFSKLDMEEVKWSTVEKTKSYNCVIVQRQMMGQDGKPFLYHKSLLTQTTEIAKENNGRLIRADKAMFDFLTVHGISECAVVLVHKAKSTQQIAEQQRRDKLVEMEKTKRPVECTIKYSNGKMRSFPLDNHNAVVETIAELSQKLPKETEPFSVREDNKYLVFPTKYLFGSGNLEVLNAVGIIERSINAERDKEGKKPIGASKYIVCNQDEPYSEDVWKVILRGEDIKLKQNRKV